MEKKIGTELEELMQARKSYFAAEPGGGVRISEESELKALAAVPVNVMGDVTGCTLIIGDEDDICTETEMKLCQSVAMFLGKQLDA